MVASCRESRELSGGRRKATGRPPALHAYRNLLHLQIVNWNKELGANAMARHDECYSSAGLA